VELFSLRKKNHIAMKPKHSMPELSSGSMADIAFLLLTFYMMTTVIKDNKGLALLLPPHLEKSIEKPIPSRNLFTIQINSHDQIMVEGKEAQSLDGIRAHVKDFILNNGKDSQSSISPEKAVVSIKTDRGTSYKIFLAALDEAQAAYYEIYGSRAGMSTREFRELDLSRPSDRIIYDNAKRGIPMNISIAEPTAVVR
jgi:biopolymer transport protein ExbD